MDTISLDVTGLSAAEIAEVIQNVRTMRDKHTPTWKNPAATAQDHEHEWMCRWGINNGTFEKHEYQAFNILRDVLNDGMDIARDWSLMLCGLATSTTGKMDADQARSLIRTGGERRDAFRGLKQAFERAAARHEWAGDAIWIPNYRDGYSGLASVELSAAFRADISNILFFETK